MNSSVHAIMYQVPYEITLQMPITYTVHNAFFCYVKLSLSNEITMPNNLHKKKGKGIRKLVEQMKALSLYALISAKP